MNNGVNFIKLLLICRWLPGSKQFQLPKNPHDPYSQLYLILDKGKLLQSIAVLLASPGSGNSGSLINVIYNLLLNLTSTDHGLSYLATNQRVTTTIVKSLIQV